MMNYLSQLMAAKNVTAVQLAKKAGVAEATVREYMKNDILDFTRKTTLQKIAKAMNCTPREIVKGGDSMKKKILEAEVIRAAESLCVALRKFSDESMYLHFTVFTRDNTVRCEGDPEGIPDYYTIRVFNPSDLTEDEACFPDISKTSRVYYNGDKISDVIDYL